jgi:hypothetical protein
MKSLIAVLFGFGAVTFAYAVTIAEVQIVEFGPFHKTPSNALMFAPNSITGMSHAVSEATLIEKTTDIHASIGTSFSLRIKIAGEPDGAVVELTAKCIHPKLSDPTSGRSSTVETWNTYPVIGSGGSSGYVGFTFDNPWELVPGKWTIQIFDQFTLLAEKAFDVTVTGIASNQALERTVDQAATLLSMTSTLKPPALRAFVSGRSACSR